MQGDYENDHTLTKGKSVTLESCDTNGEVRKWDAHGNRVYD
jgi:hypothetical protein